MLIWASLSSVPGYKPPGGNNDFTTVLLRVSAAPGFIHAVSATAQSG
jgi:hypothetical protein